tara:strand:+ start:158 stop:355 length:198 start_codon:yes stop_codon:yes gene_type:complete
MAYNTILSKVEFKALVKPSNEDSFYWYIAGMLDTKDLSEADSRALRRYQKLGYKGRLIISQRSYY